jgi:hypothetical protein
MDSLRNASWLSQPDPEKSAKSNRPQARRCGCSRPVREQTAAATFGPVEDPDPDRGSDLFFRIGVTPADR